MTAAILVCWSAWTAILPGAHLISIGNVEITENNLFLESERIDLCGALGVDQPTAAELTDSAYISTTPAFDSLEYKPLRGYESFLE